MASDMEVLTLNFNKSISKAIFSPKSQPSLLDNMMSSSYPFPDLTIWITLLLCNEQHIAGCFYIPYSLSVLHIPSPSYYHPPLGSTQPAMSSLSPPLAPPSSLFLSAWLILFFLSFSPGGHLARLRRSIPGTALQENPVSCYSGSMPLRPLPHHQSNSYHTCKMDVPTYTQILYVQTQSKIKEIK